MKFSRRAVAYSLMLSLAVVALTSIPVGGGNLEYDLVVCPASNGDSFCHYIHGHGVPWVWLKLESVTKYNSGETISLSIKQLMPLNLSGDIIIWLLPTLIILSLRRYTPIKNGQPSKTTKDEQNRTFHLCFDMNRYSDSDCVGCSHASEKS